MGNTDFADPLLSGADNMKRQFVDPIQCDEGCDGNQAAVALGQTRTFPNVTEEYVVGQVHV